MLFAHVLGDVVTCAVQLRKFKRCPPLSTAFGAKHWPQPFQQTRIFGFLLSVTGVPAAQDYGGNVRTLTCDRHVFMCLLQVHALHMQAEKALSMTLLPVHACRLGHFFKRGLTLEMLEQLDSIERDGDVRLDVPDVCLACMLTRSPAVAMHQLIFSLPLLLHIPHDACVCWVPYLAVRMACCEPIRADCR